jgi:hypothetical protein
MDYLDFLDISLHDKKISEKRKNITYPTGPSPEARPIWPKPLRPGHGPARGPLEHSSQRPRTPWQGTATVSLACVPSRDSSTGVEREGLKPNEPLYRVALAAVRVETEPLPPGITVAVMRFAAMER